MYKYIGEHPWIIEGKEYTSGEILDADVPEDQIVWLLTNGLIEGVI